MVIAIRLCWRDHMLNFRWAGLPKQTEQRICAAAYENHRAALFAMKKEQAISSVRTELGKYVLTRWHCGRRMAQVKVFVSRSDLLTPPAVGRTAARGKGE